MSRGQIPWLIGCLLLLVAAYPSAADTQQGAAELQSAGPLAFSPEGVLFVGDPKAAKVFAIETGDRAGDANLVSPEIDAVNDKVAAMLGTTKEDILINDVAVNPASGSVYLSVSRGRGPDAAPVILRVDGDGELGEFSLEGVQFTSVALPNAPEDAERGEGRRRRNQRMESITDLTYMDGKLFIAGLSNEEFASKLRTVSYPFDSADAGTSVEIFHGAHGQYETRSPVRTFATYEIDETPHLLAAYTCTPLVKFPVSTLTPGDKVTGTTVAELGNRNRPLDMIVYEKDGKNFVLMANSSRGLMKISLDGVADIEGITQPVRGTAGLTYDTLSSVEGVVQLDRLNDSHAVVLVQSQSGVESVQTLALP